MKIYRIVASRWAKTLTTASGRKARWNSNGVEMLYFSENRSLACLENIVHRSGTEILGIAFSLVVVDAPDTFFEIIANDLPDGWENNDENGYQLCRPFGDAWVSNSLSVMLKVPSVIVPGEYNFLVNPKHPDIELLNIEKITPFPFDHRIKQNLV